MASILYLGTDEGVVTLRSEDGRSWELENQGLKDWAIPKLAVDPSAPNRVFAGTRGDGVWVTEDFGKSWKKPCYGKRGPGKVRCVTLDPKDPNTVYAGTEPIDIFVSRDAAKSWTRFASVWDVPWVSTVTYPVSTVEPHVREITIDPKDSKTIYAALQVGYILKSTDSGATWKLLDKELDCDVHTIVIDPENTDNIFIATGGHDYRLGKTNGKALYISKDAGENWSPTGMEFSQEYSVPLIMHPKNPKVLYSAMAHGQPGRWRRRPTGAESIIVRTKDGGSKWEQLEGGLSEVSKGFAEAVIIDEAKPEHLYAALRNGDLYSSQDSGDSWAKMDISVSSVSDMKCAHA